VYTLINALGINLLDNQDLESVAETAARLNRWEFLLTAQGVRVAPATPEFAINASNRRHWHGPIRAYIDECLAGTNGGGDADFNMRWIASLVAEVHRILIRGGLFMYPHDTKDSVQAARLRLRRHKCLKRLRGLAWMARSRPVAGVRT
jgi:fructose-1,6-bisphosphatase